MKKFSKGYFLFFLTSSLILTLIIVNTHASNSVNIGSENGILTEEWRYDMHWYSWGWFGSSPAIADLGPDVNCLGGEPNKNLEIITGSDELWGPTEENIYSSGVWRAFDSTGNVEWLRGTQTDEARSSLAIADLDGNGELEMVGGTTSGWYVEVMDHKGDFVWTFPKLPGEYYGGPFVWPSSPAVADLLESVSGLEVVIGNRYLGNIWCFDGDNSDLIDEGISITQLDFPGFFHFLGFEGIDWDVLWIAQTNAEVVASPAIGDVDSDGELEIVIGSTDGNLYILKSSDGTIEHVFPTQGPIYASAAIANIDEDEYLEIVVGSLDNNVYCIQWDGNVRSVEWCFPTQADVYSSAVVGDIDFDGDFETIVGSNDNNIYCIDSSGGEMWNYPTEGCVYSSPALANRGFGRLDVYVGSDDGCLHLINGKTGDKIDKFQTYYSSYGGIHTSPSIADVDGDQKLEIFFYDWGQGSVYGGHTFWALEDTNSKCCKYAIEWKMFRQDNKRTGFYEIPLKAAELAKEVIGGDYVWGAKGWNWNPSGGWKWGEGKYVCPSMIKDGYYYYTPETNKIELCQGLDCSGLILWAYHKAFGVNTYYGQEYINDKIFFPYPLGHADIHLDSWWNLENKFIKQIDKNTQKNSLKEGDILFFDTPRLGKALDHVAMYVDDYYYSGGTIGTSYFPAGIYDCVEANYNRGAIVPRTLNAKTFIWEESGTIKTYEDVGLRNDYKIGNFEGFKGFGRVINPPITLETAVITKSPIDLILNDPENLIISKENDIVPGEYYYMEFDLNGDQDLEDYILISELKEGDYFIEVLPEQYESPLEKYSIYFIAKETTFLIAENVQINDIPENPYIIRVTETDMYPIIPATIDFSPDTLNIQSEGNWVTVYIELPIGHGYNLNDVIFDSILLNGQLKPKLRPRDIGDYDNDGIMDLMIKFSRDAIYDLLNNGEHIDIIVTGTLTGDHYFEGKDIIRVISN